MPQMKPMNWIMLFIMMNLIIMFINIKNYYYHNNKKIMNNKYMKMNYNNWKW